MEIELIGAHILALLNSYGYYIMVPAMFFEGPITTLISSTLASVGVFNIYLVFLFSLFVDLASDILLYYLGYRYGFGFVRKVGRYIGITENLVKRTESYFKSHGGKTIFLVKSTTGLCQVTFVAAGIAKMDFKKFITSAFLGGVVWSSFLVLAGYFYGYLWKEIAGSIQDAGTIILIVAALTALGLNIFRNYQNKKALLKG